MKQKQPKGAQPDGASERPADAGWESCYRTAEKLYAQGAYQEAFAWYGKAAELPGCNPIVFFELGYMYQHGEGVDSDSVEAVRWYEKAASLSVPHAMYNLAYFYQNGLVVDPDIEKAARLLRDATSLMDRLQLERSSYNAWKAEHDARLAETMEDAEETRARAEDLESRNRELDSGLSEARRECHRLEQEAARQEQALRELERQLGICADRANSAENALRKEQEARKEAEFEASTRQAQMEERLRASDELVTSLAREHGESFERVQSSYAAQIDSLRQAYETDFKELQEDKERLGGQNTDLSRTLDGKISELGALQETLEQLQAQLRRERRKKSIAFILACVFGAIALLLLI